MGIFDEELKQERLARPGGIFADEIAAEKVSPVQGLKSNSWSPKAIGDVGKLIYDIPIQAEGAVAHAVSAGKDPNLAPTWANKAIKAADERIAARRADLVSSGTQNYRLIPGTDLIQRKDILDTSASTGFSAVSMVPSVAAGAAGLALGATGVLSPVGATAVATGMAGSGKLAFNMDKDTFTRSLLDKAEAESVSKNNRPLSQKEREAYLLATEDIRNDHALWEAGPEAVGNAIGLVGLGKVVTGFAGKGLKKAITGYLTELGGELATETITQTGQQQTEQKLNPTEEGSRTWGLQDTVKSLKEVAPSTILLTGLTGTGAAITGKAIDASKNGWSNPDTQIKIDPLNVIRQANLTPVELVAIRNSPEALAAKGLAPEHVDALIQENALQLEEVKRFQSILDNAPSEAVRKGLLSTLQGQVYSKLNKTESVNAQGLTPTGQATMEAAVKASTPVPRSELITRRADRMAEIANTLKPTEDEVQEFKSLKSLGNNPSSPELSKHFDVPVINDISSAPKTPFEQAAEVKLAKDAAVAPEAIAPEAIAPEAIAPEAIAPEVVAPEAIAPEAITPEAITPEAVAPEAVAPRALAEVPEDQLLETVLSDKTTKEERDQAYAELDAREKEALGIKPEETTNAVQEARAPEAVSQEVPTQETPGPVPGVLPTGVLDGTIQQTENPAATPTAVQDAGSPQESNTPTQAAQVEIPDVLKRTAELRKNLFKLTAAEHAELTFLRENKKNPEAIKAFYTERQKSVQPIIEANAPIESVQPSKFEPKIDSSTDNSLAKPIEPGANVQFEKTNEQAQATAEDLTTRFASYPSSTLHSLMEHAASTSNAVAHDAISNILAQRETQDAQDAQDAQDSTTGTVRESPQAGGEVLVQEASTPSNTESVLQQAGTPAQEVAPVVSMQSWIKAKAQDKANTLIMTQSDLADLDDMAKSIDDKSVEARLDTDTTLANAKYVAESTSLDQTWERMDEVLSKVEKTLDRVQQKAKFTVMPKAAPQVAPVTVKETIAGKLNPEPIVEQPVARNAAIVNQEHAKAIQELDDLHYTSAKTSNKEAKALIRKAILDKEAQIAALTEEIGHYAPLGDGTSHSAALIQEAEDFIEANKEVLAKVGYGLATRNIKTAKQLLTSLSKAKGINDFSNDALSLLNTLLETLGDRLSNVKVVMENGIRPYYADGVIHVSDTAHGLYTALHETIHALSSDFIDANPKHPAVQKLTVLFNSYKAIAARTNADEQYGFTDIHEMVSEAYTNPTFREFLSSIPYQASNMWDAMWNAIKQMFGKGMSSALDQVLTLGDETIKGVVPEYSSVIHQMVAELWHGSGNQFGKFNTDYVVFDPETDAKITESHIRFAPQENIDNAESIAGKRTDIKQANFKEPGAELLDRLFNGHLEPITKATHTLAQREVISTLVKTTKDPEIKKAGKLIQRMQGYTRDAKNQTTNWATRLLGSPEFYMHKTSASTAMLEAAMTDNDRKFELKEQVFGDFHDTINKILSTNEEGYNEGNQLALEIDRTGISFGIRTDGTSWIVTNRIGQDLTSYATEVEAIAALEQAEQSFLKQSGVSKDARATVLALRQATNRGFNEMVASMRAQIARDLANGVPESTAIFINDEGKKESIPLSVLIDQVNDLRGSYFPRERVSRQFHLTATQEGKPNVLETFKGYFPHNTEGSKLKETIKDLLNNNLPVGQLHKKLVAQGYDPKNIRIDPVGSPNDLIFDFVGMLAGLDAIMTEASKAVEGEGIKDIEKVYLSSINNALAMRIADIYKAKGSMSSKMHRADKYWEGFETDLNRAVTGYTNRLTTGISKRETARKMLEAFTGRAESWVDYKARLQKAGKTEKQITYSGYTTQVKQNRIDPQKQDKLYEDARLFMKTFLSPANSVEIAVGMMKSATVLWYLGGRVMTSAINSLTMATTVPATLAAHTGLSLTRSGKHIAQASAAWAQHRRNQLIKEGYSIATLGKTQTMLSALDNKLLDQIYKKGWAEAQFNHDAVRAMTGKIGKVHNTIMYWAMYMFGKTESMNRAITVMAAYKAHAEKAKYTGDSIRQDLLQLAKHSSDRAHGIYGKVAKPWLVQKFPLLDAGYTFMKYQHTYAMNMVEIVGKYDSKKAASYMLLAPQFLAGTSFAALAATLLAKALGHDDPEDEYAKLITELVGDKYGDQGFTERMAKGGVMAAIFNVNVKGSMEPKLGVPTKILELGGAPVSLTVDWYDGVNAAIKGEYSKSAEKLLPSALRGLFKGYREYTEGVTNSQYAPVFHEGKPLKTTSTEMVERVIGANPWRTSDIRNSQWKEDEVRRKYTERRTSISALFNRLTTQGAGVKDPRWNELYNKIEAYNAKASKADAKYQVPLVDYKWLKSNMDRSFKPSKQDL